MKYEISKSLIKLDELEHIIREINYGELNKTWVNSIENAWIKGAFLDKRGIVWIKYQYLPKLARIKKELVNYYLALIGLPISDYISGTDFVNLIYNIELYLNKPMNLNLIETFCIVNLGGIL